jgi:hypothetical protein
MVVLLAGKGTAGREERLHGLHEIYVPLHTSSDRAS